MESLSYRFGLRDNASQTVSLRGDSIFYAEASTYQQSAAGTGAAGQTITLANPAIPYTGDTIAGTRFVLGVSLRSGKRLTFGSDYTEAVSGTAADGSRAVTLTITAPVATTDQVKVIYQSPTVAVYPQASHALATAVRPAAIKGRDIEVRIGGTAITDRWSSVQSVGIAQRITLDRDEEFGNAEAVAADLDVPEVTGTVEIKPRLCGRMVREIVRLRARSLRQVGRRTRAKRWPCGAEPEVGLRGARSGLRVRLSRKAGAGSHLRDALRTRVLSAPMLTLQLTAAGV